MWWGMSSKRGCSRWVLWQAVLLLLLSSAAPLHAQRAPGDAAPETRLAAGIDALAQMELERAESLLETLFAANPAYASPEHGAAAYWLCRTYEALGDTVHMRRTWQAGLRALDAAGRFDVRLAHAYLQDLLRSQQPADHQTVEQTYFRLLRHAGTTLTPSEAAILRRHVAQVLPLLPDGMRAHVVEGNAAAWSIRPDAGRHLMTWWRRQDPLPATPSNERVIEHLLRVARAEHAYPYDEHPSGLDDRGLVFVRFGEPAQQSTIAYDDPAFSREVFRFGVPVAQHDFPRNEIWTYPHIDGTGYYLFIEEGGAYRLGPSSDLLPPQLRRGYTTSTRDLNVAVSSLAALRYIYGQLALYHIDFSGRYAAIEAYALWQEEQRINTETGGRQAPGLAEKIVGTGFGQERRVYANPLMSVEPPAAFVQSTLEQSREADRQATRRREVAMPRQHTEVVRQLHLEPLAVAARAARFLGPDGTTRTEIAWSPQPGALLPSHAQREALQPNGVPFRDYVITTTAVQLNAAYEPLRTQLHHHAVTDLPADEDAIIPAQTLVVRGDTGRYHLALQWDQHAARLHPRGATAEVGARLKVGVERFDSLDALTADDRVLEMSDLQPVFLHEGLDALDAEARSGTPYPFATLSPLAPLALYFEVYHLVFGPDAHTRFSISYQVERRREGRLLARRQHVRSAGQADRTHQARTAREHLVIDPSTWGDADAVTLTVVVTDLHTNQRVARSIAFDMAE